MKDEIEEVPVLVVGAGPAGLTAAITLARSGIQTLVVERRPRPSELPRATGISTATMELLRSWGLEPRVRAGAIDVEWQLWACETLASARRGLAVDAGLPTREQSALVSPTAPACAPQDHLEPVLEDHLGSFAEARVDRGVEVTDVEVRTDGFAVGLEEMGTGRRRWVRSRYLIAADGIRSTVRRALGVPTRGGEHLGERLAVLFRAPLWDLVGELRYGLYPITGGDVPCFFLPVGNPDRWVYGAEWDPDRDGVAGLTPERVTDSIRLAAGDPDLTPRIERIGTASYAVELADRFRADDAFLIGDAAHRVTPRGGTGMNSAIRDGYDLGWKLAWVLRGWADERLLDTYEAERRPVAEHNAARSADPNMSGRGVAGELRADLGGRIAHSWLPGDEGRVSTLDLLGDGLTLFTGPHGGPWHAAAGSAPGAVSVTVRPLDELTARALGVRGAGALLARPDGLPVALWADGAVAPQELRRAVASATGGIHPHLAPRLKQAS